jgi:hypothetical protein
VSWMARTKSQHASRAPGLAVLSLHPVLSSGEWPVSSIGLCSGGTPEDTYCPRLPRPPYFTVLSQQRSPSLDDRYPGIRLFKYRRLALVRTCFVSHNLASYIRLALLCRLPQGYHQERIQQHEIVVIPGNTQRKRRFGVARKRNNAGQWRSSNRKRSEAD